MKRLHHGLLTISLLLFASLSAQAAQLTASQVSTACGNPSFFANANGTLFFGAQGANGHFALWKSDGTSAGTTVVNDLNPNGNSLFEGGGSYIFAANGSVYFYGTDGTNYGMWTSDGTAAGTKFVSSSCDPSAGIGYGGYFVFSNENDGTLWMSDGLTQDTFQLSPEALYPFAFTVGASGTLFFIAGSSSEQLWEFNSTVGTVCLSSTLEVSAIEDSFLPPLLVKGTAGSSTVLFVANTGSSSNYQIYSANEQTGIISTITQPTWAVGTIPVLLGVSGSTIYFTADDGSHGAELWVTNGTNSTTKVIDVAPGTPYNVRNLGAVLPINGTLVLGSPSGLWKTNGTTTGTVKMSTSSFYPSVAANGYLFGNTNYSFGTGTLYSTDGTTSGTLPVINGGLTSSTYVNQPEFIAVGTTVFIMSSTGGYSLYAIKGSGPTVATAAKASPNPCPGTSVALSVLGSDVSGEPNLRYTWSTTGSMIFIGNNGTNAGKNLTASFSAAGTYTITCTITNPQEESVTSSVSVTVTQTLSAIAVSATPTSLFQHQQFTRTGLDQFYHTMTTQPTVTWSLSGQHNGTINSSGYYASNLDLGGPYTVTATSGSITGTAYVTTYATSLMVVTGNAVSINGQPVSETISISGSTGSQTISLTGATFSGGGTSKNQATQTTTQYTILPNNGSTSIGAEVGTQSISPSITISTNTITSFVRIPGLASSLAIGPGDAQAVLIEFTPALPPQVKLVWSIGTADGSNPGSAHITTYITNTSSTVSFIVQGDIRSGIGSHLQVIANSTTNGYISPAIFCSGPPFTVCPHPAYMGLNDTPYRYGLSPLHGKVDPKTEIHMWGILAGNTSSSDTTPTGSQGELNLVDVTEQISIGHKDANAWSVGAPHIQTDIIFANKDFTDTCAVSYPNIIQKQSGTLIYNQLYEFHCQICGVSHTVVDNSAFIHTHTTVAPEGGAANTLATSDAPPTGTIWVGTDSSAPGHGSTPSDSTTPTPP